MALNVQAEARTYLKKQQQKQRQKQKQQQRQKQIPCGNDKKKIPMPHLRRALFARFKPGAPGKGLGATAKKNKVAATRAASAGEPAQFNQDSENDEYAIIAFLPEIDPGARVAIFTGLTTNGTQAAVEFACNPNSVQQLAKAIGQQGDAFVPFESVLHIKMSGGVPLQADIAAIHTHP